MSEFEKNWMRAAGFGVVIFGVLIALFAFPATETPMRIFFELLGKPLPADPGQHFRFAMGLMGCISVGWGLTLMVAAEAAHHLGKEVATKFWRGIVWAVAIWFVTDSAASIYTGYPRNAISNALLVLLLLVPIISSGALVGGRQTKAD
jgi:hypothetical protein